MCNALVVTIPILTAVGRERVDSPMSSGTGVWVSARAVSCCWRVVVLLVVVVNAAVAEVIVEGEGDDDVAAAAEEEVVVVMVGKMLGRCA